MSTQTQTHASYTYAEEKLSDILFYCSKIPTNSIRKLPYDYREHLRDYYLTFRHNNSLIERALEAIQPLINENFQSDLYNGLQKAKFWIVKRKPETYEIDKEYRALSYLTLAISTLNIQNLV